MRSRIRAQVNHLFIKYPSLGHYGYDFLRLSGLDRSTKGTKPFFKKLARRGFSPQMILDIGANHGGWSRLVNSVFKDAHFFLIEPQLEMRPFLDKFCSQSPRAKWILAGAGAEKGELMLTVWDDYQGSAFISPEIQRLTPHKRQRLVPVVAVDDLVASGEFSTPDLIKIDVQGFELEVLRGAIGCLGITEIILVETSLFHPLGQRPNIYRLIEMMEAYGYYIFDLTDLKYRRASGALGQVDICFIHRSIR
ncbi:MAG: FkbM family methyltransferase [Candidatus Promineifilaceae bacterium]|nr:FkbM family methyltransferase [Candidatus Promineifilaceae bacterium]